MNEFARYARDLARAAVGIEDMAEAAERRTAQGAAQTARDIAPEKTGEMKRKIRVVKRRAGGWAVESPDVAAVFQEFGTSDMAPNPSIRPAIEVWGPRLVHDVEVIRGVVVKRLS